MLVHRHYSKKGRGAGSSSSKGFKDSKRMLFWPAPILYIAAAMVGAHPVLVILYGNPIALIVGQITIWAPGCFLQ